MSVTLNEVIHLELQRRHLSVNGLAQKAGIGRNTLHKLLAHPDSTPERPTLRKLATALRLDEQYVFALAYDEDATIAAARSQYAVGIEDEAVLALVPLLARLRRDYPARYELVYGMIRDGLGALGALGVVAILS